eukprot:gene9971-7849_t
MQYTPSHPQHTSAFLQLFSIASGEAGTTRSILHLTISIPLLSCSSFPQPLVQLALQAAASNVESYTCLPDLMPDHLALALFDQVLSRGKLTPNVMRTFGTLHAGNELLELRIKSLNLRDPPPRVSSSQNKWLGQPPGWY